MATCALVGTIRHLRRLCARAHTHTHTFTSTDLLASRTGCVVYPDWYVPPRTERDSAQHTHKKLEIHISYRDTSSKYYKLLARARITANRSARSHARTHARMTVDVVRHEHLLYTDCYSVGRTMPATTTTLGGRWLAGGTNGSGVGLLFARPRNCAL